MKIVAKNVGEFKPVCELCSNDGSHDVIMDGDLTLSICLCQDCLRALTEVAIGAVKDKDMIVGDDLTDARATMPNVPVPRALCSWLSHHLRNVGMALADARFVTDGARDDARLRLHHLLEVLEERAI